MVDADGDTARVRLTDYGPLRRPLTIRVLRRRDLEDDRFANPWELVLQHFSIPLADFAAENAAFNPATMREIALVFDHSGAGTVVVDDVGLAWLHPGFRAARVPRGGVGPLPNRDPHPVRPRHGLVFAVRIIDPDPVPLEPGPEGHG